MAKAGPDTDGENQGGFAWESILVRGFSHMHDSGTGGVCDFSCFPYIDALAYNGRLHPWEISLCLSNLAAPVAISDSASSRCTAVG